MATQAALKSTTNSIHARDLILREILSVRRVFLPGVTASTQELNDLSYRLETVSHNKDVSTVLVTPPDDPVENSQRIPLNAMNGLVYNRAKLEECDAGDFFAGYDAGGKESGVNESESNSDKVSALQKLAAVIHGMSPAPSISIAHGRVRDGGYALCMGRYNLVSAQSSFQVTNPMKGLALDGGLSFVLPRLAFRLPFNKKNDLPIDMILALTGYEANCYDMVACGLATHFIGSFRTKAAMLEHELSELSPLNYNDRKEFDKVLHSIIDAYSSGQTYEDDFLATNILKFDDNDYNDLSTLIDHSQKKQCTLIDVSIAFKDAFNEKSVVGILERLKEIQGSSTNQGGEEAKVSADFATKFINSMESRSPLAIHACHRLLKEGRRRQKISESLSQETLVQTKLFNSDDYKSWRTNTAKPNTWKHKNLMEVTQDEVEELFDKS